MSRRRKWIFAIAVALAIPVLVVLGGSIWMTLRFRNTIREACSNADRLVIDFNVAPVDTPMHKKLGAMPKIVIGGKDKINEFRNLLDLKLLSIPGHCMCVGELAFRLERQDEPVMIITRHHGRSLRQCSLSTRVPNFELTKESNAALSSWLEQNAGEQLHNAEEEADRIWKQLSSEQMDKLRKAGGTSESAPASAPELGFLPAAATAPE